jgi:hypothetical protein
MNRFDSKAQAPLAAVHALARERGRETLERAAALDGPLWDDVGGRTGAHGQH